jgi:hypothetical protein
MRSMASGTLCVRLALTAVIAMPDPSYAWTGLPDDGLQLLVRTYVVGALEAADRDATIRLAEKLLTTAGVEVDWRDCSQPGACVGIETTAGVTLILISTNRPTCGTAQLSAGGTSATVLVSVECVAQAALNLKRRQPGRSHPLLFTLEARHLLGAVVAHEVGHVFGLRHTATGLMHAHLGVDDVLALRQGTLTFSPLEAAQMRASRMSLARAFEGRVVGKVTAGR